MKNNRTFEAVREGVKNGNTKFRKLSPSKKALVIISSIVFFFAFIYVVIRFSLLERHIQIKIIYSWIMVAGVGAAIYFGA